MNAFEEGMAIGRAKPHIRRLPSAKLVPSGYWECSGRDVVGRGRSPAVAYGEWADAHYLQELARINREARAQLAHAYCQEQFWSLNGMN